MSQTSFIPRSKAEHGGVLTFRKRKTRRSIDPSRPVHVVLRSELAVGRRSLMKNRKIVDDVFQKYSRRFRIRIYQKAVCGNHIHCLVKARNRRDLQNFFRVLAGQIGQRILLKHPLLKFEKKAHRGGTHPKSQKSFWSLLLYSRVVSWGRDFGNVRRYVIRNVLESLGWIAYKKRKSRFDEGSISKRGGTPERVRNGGEITRMGARG